MGWDGARLPRCYYFYRSPDGTRTYAPRDEEDDDAYSDYYHTLARLLRGLSVHGSVHKVFAHTTRKNAQSTALPYRTVLMMVLVMVSLLLLSQTSRGLPCGRLLVFHLPDVLALQGSGNLTGGITTVVFAVAVAAVAVAFVALPDSIRSQYGKLHARRGTRRGKLVFPFFTYFLSFPPNTTAFLSLVFRSSFLC